MNKSIYNFSTLFFKALTIAMVMITSMSTVYSQGNNPLSITPTPYERALRNPMMGFTHGDSNHPWASTTHTYIKWNELENHESDGLDKILAVSNQKFANLANTNRKTIPRVYLHWSADHQKYWPSDMQTDDYTSQQFQERVVRLIERLGIAWDNDPRIAFIEMGIFGKWGEHHGPSPTTEMQKIVGDAFAAAFQNKKVSVRHVWSQFTDHPFGEYWDSWAHYDQMWPHGKSIHNVNATKGRYLENYIGGEVAYNWGNWEIQPGVNSTASVSIEKHRDFVINSIRWLHCTQLRWIAGYDRSNPEAVAGAEEMQKAFGYRYVLDEVRLSMDDSLSVSFDVTNEGSAPFYYDWPVEVSLLDANTLEPVWKSLMESVDIRTWHPGSGWTEPEWTHVGGWRTNVPHENWNSSGITGWANPPQKNTVEEKFDVNIAEGNYVLALTILDPAGNVPSVRFATANYINGGRHPIAIVNTGTNMVEELPTDFIFNDPFNDRSLYYDATFEPKKYSINVSDITNGSLVLDPAGGSYLPGTNVTITAFGELGFMFDSWGGDISGTENPITITVDSDINISATFKPAPNYNLTIHSKYGEVELSPPGGIYSQGTIVTLTPINSGGYLFDKWGGDLSGSANPATIVMDADKEVEAYFYYFGGESQVAINCGGNNYTTAEGLVFVQDPYVGGLTHSTTDPISGTEDETLYKSERYGSNFSYDLPVENGVYSVTLMFAEIFFSGTGSRVFHVDIEGERVITALDIFSKVGQEAAYNEIFTVVVTDGMLNIRFTGQVNNAKISAILVEGINSDVEHFTLSASAINGVVQLNPEKESYPAGSKVQLTAVPDLGYRFIGWDGDFVGEGNPAMLYVDADMSISAHFEEVPMFTLSTTAVNGTVTIDPDGDSFEEGTEVILTATPDEGYKFSGWSGDLSGTDNPVTITMDGNKEITAEFTLIPSYTLSTTAVNGTITIDPVDDTYLENTAVTLTATPDEGYSFTGWSGDLSGTDNPVTIIMDGDKEITAEFTLIPSYTLSTTAVNGTVTIDPAGDTFEEGTEVTLTAAPDEGYEFIGWSGDLSGTDNPATLTMDGNKEVTAVFEVATGVYDLITNKPGQSVLEQNYPNPFSVKTTIPYFLSKPGHVRLMVYNYTGQKIAVLVNEYQAAGNYTIEWETGDNAINSHPGGLYFYRLETSNGIVFTKKLMLKQ